MEQCEKLLAKMRRTTSQWKQDDVRKLYVGFGFDVDGTNHDVYIHPVYTHIRGTVPRHNPIKPCYIREAVKNIDELKSLRDDEPGGDDDKH